MSLHRTGDSEAAGSLLDGDLLHKITLRAQCTSALQSKAASLTGQNLASFAIFTSVTFTPECLLSTWLQVSSVVSGASMTVDVYLEV